MDAKGIKALADSLRGNISRVIVGKEEVVDKVLAALLAGGHVLLEDVPGTARRCCPGRWRARWTAGFRASSSRPTCCPAT